MDWAEKLDDLLQKYIPQMKVIAEEPMSRHTTFRIGGPAKRMAFPSDGAQMVLLVNFAMECGTKPLIIGNGSNLLVPDEGLDRLVIDTSAYMNKAQLGNEPNTITAEAGATLAKTADFACKAGLSGLEFAHGIPGTVGGGVCMNAGAYGGEMKDVLTEVTVMDEEGEIITLPADKLELGYRTSIIKTAGYIVLEAKLQLKKGNPEVIRETMKDLTIRRTTKQPLEYPSAGSTFKRPEGYFAGKLIMDSGLAGYQVGGAQVSEKHCGFVINAGGATARDVRTLMDNVRDIVYKKYGVALEPEVKFLGDFEA